MSRFSAIRNALPVLEAWNVYAAFKSGRPIRMTGIRHPFKVRNNPFDFATFDEVLLKQEYNIALDFTPVNIIDAGANIGLTSIFFANRFPGAKIVALEPDAENFHLLKSNTGAYANIHPEMAGLWGHEAYLAIVDDKVGNNAFTVEEVPAGTARALKAFSVEGIMERMGWESVDVLKMDIEGSEKEVFREGYQRWLPRVKVLVVELHDRMVPGASRAVFKAINEFDFSFDLKGENLVFRNNRMATENS